MNTLTSRVIYTLNHLQSTNNKYELIIAYVNI